MNRKMLLVVFCLALCPLLMAQQPTQAASTTAASQPARSIQITGSLQLTHAAQEPVEEHLLTAADLDRDQILKKARTICINSQTDFLSAATLDRALMQQKDWKKLGLNILNNFRDADLELQINRVVFTHIHTYLLTDKATGIVLASGRVRAFDGVIAAGPMAEQIVKILSAARLQAPSTSGNSGF